MIFPLEAATKIQKLPRYGFSYFEEACFEMPNGKYILRADVLKILKEMKK
jgi:hypothetical protein